MSYGFLDIAVTPSVRAVQAEMGADHIWQDFKGHRDFNRFTENEAAFIADARQLLHGNGFRDRLAIHPASRWAARLSQGGR